MSYSTMQGRFLERDPMEYVDGLNPYQADVSNPGNSVDPLGLDPTTRPVRGFPIITNIPDNDPTKTPERPSGKIIADAATVLENVKVSISPVQSDKCWIVAGTVKFDLAIHVSNRIAKNIIERAVGHEQGHIVSLLQELSKVVESHAAETDRKYATEADAKFGASQLQAKLRKEIMYVYFFEANHANDLSPLPRERPLPGGRGDQLPEADGSPSYSVWPDYKSLLDKAAPKGNELWIWTGEVHDGKMDKVTFREKVSGRFGGPTTQPS